MIRFLCAGVVCIGLTTSGPLLAQSKTTKEAPRHGWLNDLAAARALAEKTRKPLMVVFRCDP